MNGFYSSGVKGDGALAGVVLIILGLYFSFIAHRHPKMTMHTSIWLVLFSLTYFLCVRVNPPIPTNMTRRVLYLILSMGMAALATMIIRCFKFFHIRENLALIFQGGAAGVAFSFYLLSLYDNGLIGKNGARVVFIMFWVVFGLFLNLFYPRYMAPAVYPIIGAYLFMVGVDCFARTGWIVHLALFTHAYPDAFYHTSRGTQSEIAATLILAVMGCAFQRHQLLYWENAPFDIY
ncbi:hypothetical protein EV182_003310 [Spiromyces aspiralis]|uniref:Uncharacterized protein n=1 Tax=Spiromyces aspiralis TaxID=68401 RepID=A0ACC1HCV1_9FUNG|nr:hypothetical protein EV182_003310 [Spiromyces aspiralis]